MKNTVKGLLFDYGGTLDTQGKHWAKVLWELYTIYGIVLSREEFYAAYVYAEREMATVKVILSDFDFYQVLEAKLNLQFNYLEKQGKPLDKKLMERIAWSGYRLAGENIIRYIPLLEKLQGKYPMVMVSNFYGNLCAVLRDFSVYKYFDSVVESAVVGVRKPDPAIYRLGLDLIDLNPAECMVIGDSYSKDILPGKACGCQTVWLHGEEWEPESPETNRAAADYTIKDLKELETVLGVQ